MKCLLLTLTILYSSLLYSQKSNDIPDFGKVDKSELMITSCDFDKNAEAIILFDVEEAMCHVYPANVYTERKRHIRLKILNDKGLDQANIKIPYLDYSGGGEKVGNINAQTYNLDAAGNVTVSRLEKKSLFDKRISKRISEKIFTFPEVRAGSVLEYTYTVSGSVSGGLRNWNFQKSIPVRLSRYTINFPSEIDIYCQPIAVLPVERQSKVDGGQKIQAFTMRNIPALRDEPFISCEDDYVQRVESRVVGLYTTYGRINLINNWQNIVEDMMKDDDFGVQLTKNIPRTDDLEASLKTVEDPYRKMNIIYYYVRRNMEWNGYSNIWALTGVKNAWKEKKGSTGEINLILINLLKDAGLDAHPILVSTRENGRINTMVPGYSQFDKVMAYVTINEKVFILDATDKYGSPGLIPLEVMGSEGMVIEKLETRKWGWHSIWQKDQMFKDFTLVNADIDENGRMKGWVSITDMGYSRAKRLPDLKKDREKFVEKYFTSVNPGVKVDSFLVENEDKDSLPLVEKFNFDQALSASGNYKYFSLNLFSGLEKNPFVSESRFSDITFGANQQYSMVENFFLPDGFTFDELPKSIRLLMPDSSIVFTRLIDAADNRFSTRITLEFNKPVYLVEEYDKFREFYSKLFDLLNEQVVIKRKSANDKK
ncbi:MAG TPA: DUF3857 domain-containing protein [Puia sp.]|nr:DUF3857 domain-containing protein [Puia sp.]